MFVTSKLANLLVIPLALMNSLGGVLAGIWLAILGQWGSIGYGILFLIGSAIALSIAMAPGLLLAAPAAIFHEKGKMLAAFAFGFLSSLYTVAVLTVWCIAVLFFFMKRADASSIIPTLLWSYGVATGPIAWLAQKELQAGNEFSMVSSFFAQLAYLLVVLALLFTGVTLLDVLEIFGVVMVISLFEQYEMAFKIDKMRRSQ